MIVPGKYIGGTPISVREAKEMFSAPECVSVPKLLVGPWARFGCGLEGGRFALGSDVLSPPFDYIVRGDAEVVIGKAAEDGWDFSGVDLGETRNNPQDISEYAIRGSAIVDQHPGHSRGYLICEIETYRGCPRYITGGCSFCVEPLYGLPAQREPSDVVREVEALYSHGVRAFRIGRQADLFTYGSSEMGETEFPTPAPQVIESLFSGIRTVAPELQVLHIDNVNPGTIAAHPEESKEVARTIMKYHTVGDVAAFGLESLDPEVKRRNNLKVTHDEAMTAIRILNEVGGLRPDWELPHLLPGINLLYGLPGESERTLEYNMEFLQELIAEGLIVRRINIRQVIRFPDTPISRSERGHLKHSKFIRHKEEIREQIDQVMIARVVPLGTIIRSAYPEQREGNVQLLRPLGTYPLLCHMPMGPEVTDAADVFVVDHGPRSVTVLPFPFLPNRASLAQWKAVPGIGNKRAASMKSGGPWHDAKNMEERLSMELPSWFKRCLSFDLS
jgi:radical SAM superfamily enzyme with C-terminal helix-hairpin-helix motif